MFTRQAPLIYQSMIQAGLPAASASAFQNAVGQCRAPLTHRGPVQFDYTRPEMRLITPEAAKFQFPGLALDAPQSFPVKPSIPPPPPFDPPEIPPPPPPEFPDPPVPPGEPEWPPPWWPPQWPKPEGPDGYPPPPADCCDPYYGGDYIRVDGKRVSLRHRDVFRHCTFEGGMIKSVQFKGADEGDIKIKVEEKPFLTSLKVEADFEEVEFLHSVSVGPERITFEVWTAKMLKAEFKETKHIDLTECEQQ